MIRSESSYLVITTDLLYYQVTFSQCSDLSPKCQPLNIHLFPSSAKPVPNALFTPCRISLHSSLLSGWMFWATAKVLFLHILYLFPQPKQRHPRKRVSAPVAYLLNLLKLRTLPTAVPPHQSRELLPTSHPTTFIRIYGEIYGVLLSINI
mgnify:CR=1 FL=1